MKPAAKLIKDRLAEIGIPRRSVIAATGMGGVAHGHSFDPGHKNTIAEQADRLAESGDLGVIVGRYPCGCVYKAMVTTDPRHHGKVIRQAMTPCTPHECAEETTGV